MVRSDIPRLPLRLTSGEFIEGTEAADTLTGTDGDDTIWGRSGDDEIRGGSGNDAIFGGDGDDEIWGESGDDRINGGHGHDLIFGGEGDDTLNGVGDDTLDGGPGRNRFDLGGGDSVLIGTLGDDTASLQADVMAHRFSSDGSVLVIDGFMGLKRLTHIEKLVFDLGPDMHVLTGGDGNDTLMAATATTRCWRAISAMRSMAVPATT